MAGAGGALDQRSADTRSVVMPGHALKQRSGSAEEISGHPRRYASAWEAPVDWIARSSRAMTRSVGLIFRVMPAQAGIQ